MLYSFHLVASWWCQLWATLHKLPSAELFLPSKRQELTPPRRSTTAALVIPGRAAHGPCLPANNGCRKVSPSLNSPQMFQTRDANVFLPLCAQSKMQCVLVWSGFCAALETRNDQSTDHTLSPRAQRGVSDHLSFSVLWLKAPVLRKIPLHCHCISSWKS